MSRNLSITKSSNKYQYIAGHLNCDKPISPRALLKDTSELLNLPANATLLDPSKISTGDWLDKVVKFYKGGQTFNVDKKDIYDCYTILLKTDDDQIIGAMTFAPFIQETELVTYILLIKAKESYKGIGTILFNIVKEFATKCHQSRDYSQVLLLLSASTALAPHGFFKKQGCEVVTDRDLLKLTQKDSTLMQFDFENQKGGGLIKKSRDIIITIEESKNNIVNAIGAPQQLVQSVTMQQRKNDDVVENMGANIDDEPENRQLRKDKNGANQKEFEQLQQSNYQAAKTTEFKLPLNKRNLKKMEEAPSQVGSKVSNVSNKTGSGAINKHCEICNKKISGNNWSEHIKVHTKKGIEKSVVTFKLCVGDGCANCQPNINGTHQLQQEEKTPSIINKSKHQQHKQYQCQVCKKVKESRLFPKNSTICGVCDKKLKATKSAVYVPLDEDTLLLDGTSDQQQVYPDDSISMIGNKRPAKKPLDFKEVAYDATHDKNEQAEPVLSTAIQRLVQQTTRSQASHKQVDVEMVDTSAAADTINTNTLLIKLCEIEASANSEYKVSIDIADICEQFVTQQALALLKNVNTTKLALIMTKILNEQASSLTAAQLAGLFIAAFTLQGSCWTSAVQMLQKKSEDIQGHITTILAAHLDLLYGDTIAEWCVNHWRNIEEQQLNVMKAIKFKDQSVAILLLSLAVQVDSIDEFVSYTSRLLKREFMSLMVASVSNRLTQQRLSMQSFFDLTEFVQLDNVLHFLHENSGTFETTPLNQWMDKIQQYKATSHLMNSDSVKAAIEEFVKAYGPVEPLLALDLFTPDSYLGLALRECFNKPNAKQLGLAQYSIGTLRPCPRQLWSVDSGQGKSRVIAFAAAIALDLGMFTAVHIVFENEHLMKRDKEDFESLWILMNCVYKIHYHVGCEFTTQEGELIIVDESDTATFESPDNFAKLIDGRACICFTATPDNCDDNGVEARVVNALQLKVFQYVPNAPIVDAAARLKFDQIQHASSTEDKAKFIASLVVNGPVLVFGSLQLRDTLIATQTQLITVDPSVDYSMLRKLDHAPYKVLFADTQFGMRGVDYRSERVPLQLVIDQSFDSTREALQGVARVGRFGDPYTRIIFQDVELVDNMKQLTCKSGLMRFVELIRKKVQAKPVKVKQAAIQPAVKGGYTSTKGNIGRRQVENSTSQQKKITDSFF